MPHINLFLNESESEWQQQQQRQQRGVCAIYFSAVSLAPSFPTIALLLSVLLLSEGNVAYCLHNGRSLALCVWESVCVWERVCVRSKGLARVALKLHLTAASAVLTNINVFLICFI